jgi:hypothetical protein
MEIGSDRFNEILIGLNKNGINIDQIELNDFVESYSDIRDAIQSRHSIYVPALVASFQKTLNTKRDIINEIKELENYYLFDLLTSQLIEDAFAPDIVSDEILQITSTDSEFDEELQKFQKKFNLDLMCLDLSPELIKYGSYCLRPIVEKGKGIVRIDDVINSEYIIPVTSHGEIDAYVYTDAAFAELKLASRAEFINFSIVGSKLRIFSQNECNIYGLSEKDKDIVSKLPAYLRPGRPMFYPVIQKIKELQLLETLVPVSKLTKLSNGSIVGVKVPSTQGVVEALKFAKRVEQHINKQISLDSFNDKITIQNLINSSGKIKCIPMFGDKGSLETMNYYNKEPDDLLNSITDIRKVVCSQIGYPYELIFGGDEKSKGTILKKNSRYIRKLRALHASITRGLQDLVLIHFHNLGKPKFSKATKDDFAVTFRQTLVEIENLDKLEFTDASISLVKNIIGFVQELSTNPLIAGALDQKEVVSFLGDQLSLVGLNLIDKNKIGQTGQVQGDPQKLVDLETSGIDNEPERQTTEPEPADNDITNFEHKGE